MLHTTVVLKFKGLIKRTSAVSKESERPVAATSVKKEIKYKDVGGVAVVWQFIVWCCVL